MRRQIIAACVIASCMVLMGQAPAEPAAETAPAKSAEALFAEAAEQAATGKFSASLVELFVRAADQKVREKIAGDEKLTDLWEWVAKDPSFQKAVIVNLHPDYRLDLLKNLARLRDAYGESIGAYRHLALAFSIVYANAGRRGVRAGWARKHKDRDAVPDLEASFGYYLDEARSMVYPLDKLPWPLLVYVADNDVPIAERKWALARYSGATPDVFGKIYYDVPYDMEGLRNSSSGQDGLAINKHPYTLANILQYGGVCADRAYYSSRVLKSLGVPAVYDSGQGQRGGHAWLAWIAAQGGKFAMDSSGRFDYDSYYVGDVWSPILSRQILDREVELVGAAMSASYAGYLDVLVAGDAYDLVQGDARAKAANLLTSAIDARNHYVAEAWRRLSRAVAEGVLPRTHGEKYYNIMAKPFARYPDLTYQFLTDILAPRLAAGSDGEKVDRGEVRRNISLLDKAFGLYQRAKRPDLAVELRVLEGRYLEAVGMTSAALKLYVASSQQYVTEHFGFVELFDRACALLADDGRPAMRMKYLDYMAKHVPKYKSDFNAQIGDVNPAYVRVIKAYADALDSAGQAAEATHWRDELPKKK